MVGTRVKLVASKMANPILARNSAGVVVLILPAAPSPAAGVPF